jgi:hypothetical protein
LSKEGQEQYYAKWIAYNKWKVAELKNLDEIEKRIRINKAILICGVCQDRICCYKNIGNYEP